MSLIWVAINQLTELANATHLSLFSKVARFVELFQCYPNIVAFPTCANTSTKPYHSQFDTNSFTMGIDTLCSWTMSGKKNHLENLRENLPSKNVGGIAKENYPCQELAPLSSAFKMIPVKPVWFEYPIASMFQICCQFGQPTALGQAIEDQKGT